MSPDFSTNQQKKESLRGDEVTPIIHYIVGEMNRNADSAQADHIRLFNEYNYQKCTNETLGQPWGKFITMGPLGCVGRTLSMRVAAMATWAWQVHQDGPWDHKPLIRKLFTPAVPKGSTQEWHKLGNRLFYYDIWSNIHYGYVGSACGFSSSDILDGAGWEQIGSDLARLNWPNGEAGVAGMRRFDDSSDRAAIQIGIGIYPRQATVQAIKNAILTTHGLSRKCFGAPGAATLVGASAGR